MGLFSGCVQQSGVLFGTFCQCYQDVGYPFSIDHVESHYHWMRGYVLAQAGSLEAAETALRTAHEMLSSRRAALYAHQVGVELAAVLHRQGKVAEAEELPPPRRLAVPDGQDRGGRQLLPGRAQPSGDPRSDHARTGTRHALLRGRSPPESEDPRLNGDLSGTFHVANLNRYMDRVNKRFTYGIAFARKH